MSARAFVAAFLLLVPGAASADPPVVTVGSHILGMKDDSVPPIVGGKRYFSWAVRSGNDVPAHQFAVPLPGSAGDPTLHGAVLQVYNAAGSGELFTVPLPAARWRLQGSPPHDHRFLYANDPATTPVWKVWIKGPKITVRGGKQHWGYTLDEPSQGSIAIRLTVGSEATYCTEVPPRMPATSFDRRDRFQGQPRSPAPVVCPPLPAP